MTVHQMLPSLSYFDAIGNHVLYLHEVLREKWPESMIFADGFPVAELGHVAQHYPWYERVGTQDDVIVYHASIDSPMNAWLLARKEPLVVIYHNVTPGEFADPFEPGLATRLRNGRVELSWLARRAARAYGVSRFNCEDLVEWGYADPQVMPLHVDLSQYRLPVDTRLRDRLVALKGPDPAVLFVSKVAPWKGHHDLLRAQRVLVDRFPSAQLWCLGSGWTPAYPFALSRYRAVLGLPRGSLVGHVSDIQKLAFFAASDVYVSMSEHEGFAVPLVEAMACGVPVIAYDAGAVAETLGGAGLILDTKDPFVVAAAVERVWRDQDLRRQMVAAGQSRVAELANEAWVQQFVSDLVEVEAASRI